MIRFALIVATALAATPLYAQSAPDRLAGYAAVFEANDCRIYREESQTIFEAAGYPDVAERQLLGFALLLTGQMQLEDGIVRMLGEACPISGYGAPEDLARVEEYAALIEGNDCAIPVTDVQEFLAGSSFTNFNELAQIGAYLVADGRMEYADDPARVVLISEACPAN